MTVYHPDPKINAEVIADALEGELADLAAGYAPRRWRCTCGAEHSRGHFGSVGIHRCLTCGYVGPGGVMLDDGEPAPAQPVTTWPPSAVADQIVPAADVRPGEIVLWDGEYRRVERVYPMDHGNPAFVLDGESHNGTIPAGRYIAVRRYTEGPSEADQLRAELDRFKPQPMSQLCRDGKHNGTGDERCVNCWCLCHRGELSRDDQAVILAALDEAAADRDERVRWEGCAACTMAISAAEEAGEFDVFRGDERDPFTGLCGEHREHAERARQYRGLRDRLQVGR